MIMKEALLGTLVNDCSELKVAKIPDGQLLLYHQVLIKETRKNSLAYIFCHLKQFFCATYASMLFKTKFMETLPNVTPL